MNQFLTLYFFESIRTFYAWAFPMNVMVTVSMLLGLAVGLFSRRKSWLRRGFAVVCLVILAACGTDWAVFPLGRYDFPLCLRLVRGGGVSLLLPWHGGPLPLD